jgi:DNA-binding transcriptional regulator YdaS (Cro superfamily)
MDILCMVWIDHLAKIVFLSIIRRMDQEPKSGLDRAIELAGGITALARGVGVKSHAVVQQWRLNRVPAEHCPAIEALTGVPCEELRSDVKWSVLRGMPTPAANDPQAPQPAEQGVA